MTIDEHFEFLDWTTTEMNRVLKDQRNYFSSGLDSMTTDHLQSCMFLLSYEMRQLRTMVLDLQEANKNIQGLTFKEKA